MVGLEQSAIYKAVKLGKIPLIKHSKGFFRLFGFLSLLFFVAFVFLSFSQTADKIFLKRYSGAFFLSFAFYLFFLETNKFFELKLKNPTLKYSLKEAVSGGGSGINIISFFDFEAAKIIDKARILSKRKKIREISAELILYSALNSKSKKISFVFNRGEINLKELKKKIKEKIIAKKSQWLGNYEKLIVKAAKIAAGRGKGKIGVGDILIAGASEVKEFENYLTLNGLEGADILNLVDWVEYWQEKMEMLKKFWDKENLKRIGRIGRDWASGYTVLLDRYSYDLREKIGRSGVREIIGHQREAEIMERILEKENGNSIILVGEPGVGRKSVIEAVAQKSFLGKSSESVNFKRFLFFDIGQLESETIGSGTFLEYLDKCLYEALEAGNIILVIDNIHNYLQKGSNSGQGVDISGVLSRYMALPKFQMIAITDYKNLHNVIEGNPSLAGLFEKVEVEEISEKETMRFLETLIPYFESKNRIYITYKALREIILLSAKYIKESPFPDKALKILDEAISWLSLRGKKENILTDSHIKTIVSQRTEIPLEDLEEKEKETLLNLEELIHQMIINQEIAVNEVSNALRRARADIKTRSGPIGSFLFLGPTGVGKTETSKALNKIYFGKKRKMIRLDMSEFQEVSDIKKLVGDKGDGLLTTPVRENPFSLVLLDEIEKAHPNILNLFLQVLDEGWLTDGFGRKVDFKNTIIIATSNAGAEMIRERILEDEEIEKLKEELIEYLLKERLFRPEFINRFDGVIVFKPLSEKNLIDIAGLMLKKEVENLKDKGIKLLVTEDLKKEIARLGYSPEFGARAMKRVLQDKVENLLAEALLGGNIKRGDVIKIKVGNNGFSLEKVNQ